MKLHRMAAVAVLLLVPGAAFAVPAASAPSSVTAGWPATISGQTSDRYPEGIAWDPTRQAFLVGSVATGRISVVGRDGSSRVLAQAPGVSTFGLHVDAVRNRFLVTYGDIGGGERSSDETAYRQSGVGIYNLRTGRLERRVDLNTTALNPAGGWHAANDLAIDALGNAYVTDPAGDAIYKVDPSGRASVLIRDDRLTAAGFGANGIVWDPAGYLLVVNYGTGKLLRISLGGDPQLSEVAVGVVLVGGDGLALTRDRNLVAVTNKLGAPGKEAVTVFRSSDNYRTAFVATSVSWPVAAPTTAALTPHGTYVLSGNLDVMLAGGQSDTFTIHRLQVGPV